MVDVKEPCTQSENLYWPWSDRMNSCCPSNAENWSLYTSKSTLLFNYSVFLSLHRGFIKEKYLNGAQPRIFIAGRAGTTGKGITGKIHVRHQRAAEALMIQYRVRWAQLEYKTSHDRAPIAKGGRLMIEWFEWCQCTISLVVPDHSFSPVRDTDFRRLEHERL